MKYADFKTKTRALTPAELVARATELESQITKTRLEMAVHKVKNLRQVFHLRKQLAVIKSLMSK